MAIIAVLVSGAVGILSAAVSLTSSIIVTDAAHRDQETALEVEASRAELVNLREALANAELGLITGVNAAYTMTNLTGNTRINTPARWREVAADAEAIAKAQLGVERGYASIVILLGASAPITRAYEKAMGRVQIVSIAAAAAVRSHDPQELPSLDMASSIDKARIAYEKLAHKLVGAQR